MNASAMSAFRMIGDVGYVVGPLLLGIVVDLHGDAVALWLCAAAMLTVGLVSRGAWQCLPGSGLLRQIEGDVPVPCTSISMQGDRVAPPHRCRVEGATNVVLQPPRYLSAVAHQYLVLSGRTTQEIVSALSRP